MLEYANMKSLFHCLQPGQYRPAQVWNARNSYNATLTEHGFNVLVWVFCVSAFVMAR